MLLRKLAVGLLLALMGGSLLASSAGPNCDPGWAFEGALATARQQQFIPQWTPDGELLVYAEGRRIYSAQPDGTAERLISRSTDEYDIDAMPNLSPDGSRIVYAAHRESGFPIPRLHWDIATARIDGSKERLLTNDHISDLNPVWSPDGRHIAWTSGNWLMVMEADGSQLRRITSRVWTRRLPPRWSPDGQRIAFIGTATEEVAGKRHSSPLYVASLDGQALRVAEVSVYPSATPPAWSPDGRRLAFIKPEGVGRKALYTIAPDGTRPQEVMRFNSAQLTVENLSWSPDGSRIMLHYGGRLAAVNQDGTTLQKLSLDAADSAAASWSPDGTRVAVFNKDDGGLSTVASDQREGPVHFGPPESSGGG